MIATLAVPVTLPAAVAPRPVVVVGLPLPLDGPGLVPALALGQGPLATVVLGLDAVPLVIRFAVPVRVRTPRSRAGLTIVLATPRLRDVEVPSILAHVAASTLAIHLAVLTTLVTTLVVLVRSLARSPDVGLARPRTDDAVATVRRSPVPVAPARLSAIVAQYAARLVAGLGPTLGVASPAGIPQLQEQAIPTLAGWLVARPPTADLHVPAGLVATAVKMGRPSTVRPTVVLVVAVTTLGSAKLRQPRTVVAPLRLVVDPSTRLDGTSLPDGPALALRWSTRPFRSVAVAAFPFGDVRPTLRPADPTGVTALAGPLALAWTPTFRPAGPVLRAVAKDASAEVPIANASPLATTARMGTSRQVPAYVHAAVVGTAAHVPTLVPARPESFRLVPAVDPRLVPRPLAPAVAAVIRTILAVPSVHLPRLGHGLAPSALGPGLRTTLGPTSPSTLAALLDMAIQVPAPAIPTPSAPLLVVPRTVRLATHAGAGSRLARPLVPALRTRQALALAEAVVGPSSSRLPTSLPT